MTGSTFPENPNVHHQGGYTLNPGYYGNNTPNQPYGQPQPPQQSQAPSQPTYPAQPAAPSYQGNPNSYPNQQSNYQGNQNPSGYQGNNGGQKDWQGKKDWGNKGGQGGGGARFPIKPKPEEIDPTLYLSAAITGNKEAPPEILDKIAQLAQYLESKGFTIRVGGDGPVEDAAEMATHKKEVLLPWRGFNDKESPTTFPIERAFHIAKMFHPTWDHMKKGVQSILAKNARLVMGNKMMSPATLLLCWTEDGAEDRREVTMKTGLAAHPIRIAAGSGVRIFNLGRPDAESRLRHFVDGMNPSS